MFFKRSYNIHRFVRFTGKGGSMAQYHPIYTSDLKCWRSNNFAIHGKPFTLTVFQVCFTNAAATQSLEVYLGPHGQYYVTRIDSDEITHPTLHYHASSASKGNSGKVRIRAYTE